MLYKTSGIIEVVRRVYKPSAFEHHILEYIIIIFNMAIKIVSRLLQES